MSQTQKSMARELLEFVSELPPSDAEEMLERVLGYQGEKRRKVGDL